MADQFFDTSAAAKHYRFEIGTPKVEALLAQSGAAHLLSSLTVVEFYSVFARLVRMGQIGVTDFQLVSGRLLADIVSGLWRIVPVTSAHYQTAQRLLATYGLSQSLRTLDAIQLAVAIEIHFATPLEAFVCADVHLCAIARSEGLSVINPESP